jgi:hypothetical protein
MTPAHYIILIVLIQISFWFGIFIGKNFDSSQEAALPDILGFAFVVLCLIIFVINLITVLIPYFK